MTTKALFWPESLAKGYVPAYLVLRGQRLILIDWSKAYECWQPDCLDDDVHFDKDEGAFNTVLIIPIEAEKYALVWVNRFDFDFIED